MVHRRTGKCRSRLLNERFAHYRAVKKKIIVVINEKLHCFSGKTYLLAMGLYNSWQKGRNEHRLIECQHVKAFLGNWYLVLLKHRMKTSLHVIAQRTKMKECTKGLQQALKNSNLKLNSQNRHVTRYQMAHLENNKIWCWLEILGWSWWFCRNKIVSQYFHWNFRNICTSLLNLIAVRGHLGGKLDHYKCNIGAVIDHFTVTSELSILAFESMWG